MIPHIILHIGTNKTGTSALQRVLNAQRDALMQNGVLYPEAGCTGEAHYALSSALNFLHEPHPDQATQEQTRENLRRSLDAEIEEKKPTSVVLSSEYFMLDNDMEITRSFFDGFDVRVIVYLRRHDRWWESAYAQAMRSVPNPPWGPGPEAFIDWYRYNDPTFGDYEALLDRWSQVVGHDQILVRPYERQQNQPDLLADFLCTIGASDLLHRIEYTLPTVNATLPAIAVNLIDLFRRIDMREDVRQRLVEYALDLPPVEHPVPLLSPEARRTLIDEYADSYARIAKLYLKRTDGQLFYDPIPAAYEAWSPPRATARETAECILKALELT